MSFLSYYYCNYRNETSTKSLFYYVFSTQTQSNDPVHCAFTPTTKLQALSVITLAKMCLQNEDMAKRVVPAFGHLLDTTKVSVISFVEFKGAEEFFLQFLK